MKRPICGRAYRYETPNKTGWEQIAQSYEIWKQSGSFLIPNGKLGRQMSSFRLYHTCPCMSKCKNLARGYNVHLGRHLWCCAMTVFMSTLTTHLYPVVMILRGATK